MPTWKMSSNFAFLLASLRCLTILNSRRCNQIFRSYSTQWFLGGLFTKYKSRFSSYLIRSEFLTLTWTPWRSLTVAATSSSSKVQNASHLKLDQFKCFTICQSEKHILWKDQLNKKSNFGYLWYVFWSKSKSSPKSWFWLWWWECISGWVASKKLFVWQRAK